MQFTLILLIYLFIFYLTCIYTCLYKLTERGINQYTRAELFSVQHVLAKGFNDAGPQLISRHTSVGAWTMEKKEREENRKKKSKDMGEDWDTWEISSLKKYLYWPYLKYILKLLISLFPYHRTKTPRIGDLSWGQFM